MDRKDLERSKQFPHLGAAFRTNVEQFGPNDFFVMQKCMKEVSCRSAVFLSWLQLTSAPVSYGSAPVSYGIPWLDSIF